MALTESFDRPANSVANSAMMLFRSVLAAIHSFRRRTSSSFQSTPLSVRRADNEKKRRCSSCTIDLNNFKGILIIVRILVSPNMIGGKVAITTQYSTLPPEEFLHINRYLDEREVQRNIELRRTGGHEGAPNAWPNLGATPKPDDLNLILCSCFQERLRWKRIRVDPEDYDVYYISVPKCPTKLSNANQAVFDHNSSSYGQSKLSCPSREQNMQCLSGSIFPLFFPATGPS